MYLMPLKGCVSWWNILSYILQITGSVIIGYFPNNEKTHLQKLIPNQKVKVNFSISKCKKALVNVELAKVEVKVKPMLNSFSTF